MKSTPTLIIKNNLNVAVPLSLMNPSTPSNPVVNPEAEFEFNMSCEGFTGADTVSIQSRLTGAGGYTTYTASISGASTIDSVVAALNTLGLDTFYADTVGGISYIKVFSSTREYTTLNIFNLAGSQSDVFVGNFDYYNLTGGLSVYKDCVLQDNFANGSANQTTDPYDFGALVKVVYTAGSVGATTLRITAPDGTVLLNQSVATGNTLEFSFTVDQSVALSKYVIIANPLPISMFAPNNHPFVMNTASQVYIAGIAGDQAENTIQYSTTNLPAWCTLTTENYAGWTIFRILVNPGGGNLGTHLFTITATNGVSSESRIFTITVNNVTTYSLMTRPLSPDPMTRVLGDDSPQIYPKGPNRAVNSLYSAGTPNVSLWFNLVLGTTLTVTPDTASSGVGDGIYIVAYGGPSAYSDTFLIKTRITP